MQAVRIVAGALIIVVAVLNLGAFIGHSLAGGVQEEAGKFGKGVLDSFPVPSDDPVAKQARREANKAETAGTLRQLFGFFLFVLAGLAIGAGVVLFLAKAALFVMIVGALQVLADLTSLLAFGGGGTKTVVNLLAIAVGAFVAYAGFTYSQFKKGGRPAPEFPT
jgi:hypothetical protein